MKLLAIIAVLAAGVDAVKLHSQSVPNANPLDFMGIYATGRCCANGFKCGNDCCTIGFCKTVKNSNKGFMDIHF